MLKYDNSYTGATPILDSFYNNPPQGIKSVQDIEDRINIGDYAGAQGLVSAFNPTNTIENNYKDYYNLFLNYVQTGNWTSNDSDELLILAHKCIFTDGPVVVNARTFYNSLYREQYTLFNENCRHPEPGDEGGDEGGSGGESGGKSSNITDLFTVEVYPNPASQGFDLKSNCKENCGVTIVVSSLTGQRILEKTCNLLEGNCFINANLISGTYMVTITKHSTREAIVRKLLITNK
jgi:hypothetical protein